MPEIPAYVRNCRVIREIAVPMRDGVKLATTVYQPAAEGRYPVVLVRSAYGRGLGPSGFPDAGIVLVTQDCRGRYGSEGVYEPFAHEANDGYDTVEWLTKQSWCDGQVGMFGDSYLALTQLALIKLRHPAIKALNPRFMAGDCWQHAYYVDGVFSLALTFSWLCLEVGSRTSNAGLFTLYDIEKMLKHLPYIELDTFFGSECPAYRQYALHDKKDSFWDTLDYRPDMAKASAPMLMTCGWYDNYAGETFRNYLAAIGDGADPEIAKQHRVLIGPWTHGINQSSRLGQVDFGLEALKENNSTFRYLSGLLKGGKVEDFQQAPIRIFVMGINQWRDEYEWPPARAQFVKYYLHSSGRANSLLGDGKLSTTRPGESERPDQYLYDPANPVPTLGGNHSVGPYNPGLYELALPGPYDQRPIERRDDVLVYTSDVLAEDLEVTGPVEVELFIASSAPDTDFVARLCDVFPDGRSINLTEGVLRVRYRGNNWRSPSLMEAGKVYRLSIDLQVTSNVFFKGHRIRLDITSSSFPLWDRNLNMGTKQATETRMQIAQQTIFHHSEYQAHVLLPVMGKSQ